VFADPPAERLTGLPLNEVVRDEDDDRVTGPVKLSMLDRESVDCPDPPCGIERKEGVPEMLKSGPVMLILM